MTLTVMVYSAVVVVMMRIVHRVGETIHNNITIETRLGYKKIPFIFLLSILVFNMLIALMR